MAACAALALAARQAHPFRQTASGVGLAAFAAHASERVGPF
jgi:hypothetical protein